MIKSEGKMFEEAIKSSCKREGIFIHRIKDNAMSYTESDTSFTQDNPYDFLVFKTPYLFALECKRTTQTSLSIQTSEEESKKKMIKYHQIQSLKETSEFENAFGGFLFSFANQQTGDEITFYMSVDDFLTCITKTQKKSINISDIVACDGIVVSQHLMRTRYRYDMTELFDKIVERAV